ncbi:hypothetical protein pb186bvf_016171 [Paramecium bursaria]
MSDEVGLKLWTYNQTNKDVANIDIQNGTTFLQILQLVDDRIQFSVNKKRVEIANVLNNLDPPLKTPLKLDIYRFTDDKENQPYLLDIFSKLKDHVIEVRLKRFERLQEAQKQQEGGGQSISPEQQVYYSKNKINHSQSPIRQFIEGLSAIKILENNLQQSVPRLSTVGPYKLQKNESVYTESKKSSQWQFGVFSQSNSKALSSKQSQYQNFKQEQQYEEEMIVEKPDSDQEQHQDREQNQQEVQIINIGYMNNEIQQEQQSMRMSLYDLEFKEKVIKDLYVQCIREGKIFDEVLDAQIRFWILGESEGLIYSELYIRIVQQFSDQEQARDVIDFHKAFAEIDKELELEEQRINAELNNQQNDLLMMNVQNNKFQQQNGLIMMNVQNNQFQQQNGLIMMNGQNNQPQQFQQQNDLQLMNDQNNQFQQQNGLIMMDGQNYQQQFQQQNALELMNYQNNQLFQQQNGFQGMNNQINQQQLQYQEQQVGNFNNYQNIPLVDSVHASQHSINSQRIIPNNFNVLSSDSSRYSQPSQRAYNSVHSVHGSQQSSQIITNNVNMMLSPQQSRGSQSSQNYSHHSSQIINMGNISSGQSQRDIPNNLVAMNSVPQSPQQNPNIQNRFEELRYQTPLELSQGINQNQHPYQFSNMIKYFCLRQLRWKQIL